MHLLWTHEGPPLLPPPYTDLLPIFPRPGKALVERALQPAPRLIPTAGRPPVAQTVRGWAGDSRGRWEGDTLVVDTTNFNPKTAGPGVELPTCTSSNASPAAAERRQDPLPVHR